MKNINEVEANKIDIKPFKVKDKLNPDFFNSEGQLNSQIRLRLLDIADDFVKSLAVKWVKPSDIVLTGSIANYNWSKYSDVDIHIIYNFNDVYKKTEFVKDYFNSKRDIWNDTHEGLTIKNLPVEISIEDSSNPAKSSGVYSLEKNKWVKEPENMNDSELNKEYIKDFCAKQMTKFDELFDEIDNETDRKKLEILSNKVEALYEKLKNMRGEALKSKEKEMATGNIIWKVIKHQGYIERAWDYINKVYDRRNTINENKPGKIVRITNKQAKIINEVYDASKLAKFGPVKRYFHYLNLELPLKGEYELRENDPKDKQIVCKCLSAVGSPRLKAQIHDKDRSGCIFGEDLVKYLGNFQNRNMLRNAIMKEKGDFTRKQEYSKAPSEDYTPAASNMNNFINISDVSELNEAAMPEFNLQALNSIKSFAGKLKYCKQMLGPSFGSGSSRIIFEIDDEKVLKLAKNKKGLAQNEFEDDTSRYGDVVVKVFECADDYSWLVEENCVPAKEKDFEQIIGLPFETYCDLVKWYYNKYSRKSYKLGLYTISNDEAQNLVDQLYEQDDYGFVPQIFNLMGDYQLPCGDLTRISTYGMVKRNGTPEIVVIDSGLSEEILNTYY
jgi:predicted nucleotidyltransferase